MKDNDIKDLIKDLNTYHEEKERKYFERNLIKQKIGKYLFIFLIVLVIVAYIVYLILNPEKPIKETTFFFDLLNNIVV